MVITRLTHILLSSPPLSSFFLPPRPPPSDRRLGRGADKSTPPVISAGMTRVRIRGDYSSNGDDDEINVGGIGGIGGAGNVGSVGGGGVGGVANKRRKPAKKGILDAGKLIRDGIITTRVRSIPNGYKLRLFTLFVSLFFVVCLFVCFVFFFFFFLFASLLWYIVPDFGHGN